MGAVMKKAVWMAVALVVAISGAARAQTPTRALAWDQAGLSVAEANAATYTLTVDGGAPTKLTQACTAGGPALKCQAPLVLPALAAGTHTLVLTVSNGFSSASSAPLSGSAPGAPSNLTITITINVTTQP
jgi:hypothetical protein